MAEKSGGREILETGAKIAIIGGIVLLGIDMLVDS